MDLHIGISFGGFDATFEAPFPYKHSPASLLFGTRFSIGFITHSFQRFKERSLSSLVTALIHPKFEFSDS
ncbi:MAG: hypothetical protein LUC26_08040 [Prevotella sp.]|nr:hypothetical protein [Prevotella sp.]